MLLSLPREIRHYEEIVLPTRMSDELCVSIARSEGMLVCSRRSTPVE